MKSANDMVEAQVKAKCNLSEEAANGCYVWPLSYTTIWTCSGSKSKDLDISGRGLDVTGAGKRGEVLTRGPHVMKAYWNDTAATSAAFLPGEASLCQHRFSPQPHSRSPPQMSIVSVSNRQSPDLLLKNTEVTLTRYPHGGLE